MRFVGQALAVSVVLASASCAVATKPTPPIHAAPVPAKEAVVAPRLVAAKTLDDLTMLATGDPRSHDGASIDAVAFGKPLEAFVDGLLATDGFAEKIAPRMILKQYNRPFESIFVGARYVLSSFMLPKGTTYYLRAPCKEADVELVEPWWDLGTELRVCRDAYRPNVTGDPKTGYRCWRPHAQHAHHEHLRLWRSAHALRTRHGTREQNPDQRSCRGIAHHRGHHATRSANLRHVRCERNRP